MHFKFPLLIVSLVLAMSSMAAAQTPKPTSPPEETTKLEKFKSRTGSVIIKNFSRLGSVRGIGGTLNVLSMDFTDAQSGAKVQGIVIEIRESGRLERSDRSFIDSDEIEGLLKGIDYISKVQAPTSKQDLFEARYRTRGDFAVTTFNSSDASEGIQVALTIGRISQVSVYLNEVEADFAVLPIVEGGGRTFYIDTYTQAERDEYKAGEDKRSGQIGDLIERIPQ